MKCPDCKVNLKAKSGYYWRTKDKILRVRYCPKCKKEYSCREIFTEIAGKQSKIVQVNTIT